MQMAIDEAMSGITSGDGGPFGSVVVKEGIVIGRGHNRVLGNNDPTAHGEVEAIRDACHRLGTHDLTGCDVYTTGEPCHMCLCACMWANIKRIYYGCTIKDNAIIGFRDDAFNDLFSGRDKLPEFLVECDREACLDLFDEYLKTPHKNY
ncbi:MAG: nucleoside deaminase [Bacteroidales bacterium]|nr:nucleoside deaminase [Bacteroidales bacterium]